MKKYQSTKYQIKIHVLHFLDDDYIYKEIEKPKTVFHIILLFWGSVVNCETQHTWMQTAKQEELWLFSWAHTKILESTLSILSVTGLLHSLIFCHPQDVAAVIFTTFWLFCFNGRLHYDIRTVYLFKEVEILYYREEDFHLKLSHSHFCSQDQTSLGHSPESLFLLPPKF